MYFSEPARHLLQCHFIFKSKHILSFPTRKHIWTLKWFWRQQVLNRAFTSCSSNNLQTLCAAYLWSTESFLLLINRHMTLPVGLAVHALPRLGVCFCVFACVGGCVHVCCVSEAPEGDPGRAAGPPLACSPSCFMNVCSYMVMFLPLCSASTSWTPPPPSRQPSRSLTHFLSVGVVVGRRRECLFPVWEVMRCISIWSAGRRAAAAATLMAPQQPYVSIKNSSCADTLRCVCVAAHV